MFKVVYIDYNFIDKRYPNTLEDGDHFFTYGFGSTYARRFKKFSPDVKVECWKADSRITQIHKKTIENVDYIIFPSIRLGKLGHYSRQLVSHLNKELKTSKKTIFNISSIRHLLFYSLALRIKSHPLIVQNHGEATAIYKTKINKGLKKVFYALQIPVEKLCFKNINIFFILDRRMKTYLPNTSNNTRILLSTTGVDEEIFTPIQKIEAKRMLEWDINKKHIIYVGRLNFTKRPDILLDIYEEFKNEGRKDIELVLAGNEKDDPLYERAKASGAIIYPKILQIELYRYLSASDVYVLPKYSDDHAFGGIGMLPIQSLLCETPVIGASLLNFPETDVDKVGIIAWDKEKIKKAIIEVLDNKKKYEDLRHLAIKYYSWENISKQTFSLYTELFNNEESQ